MKRFLLIIFIVLIAGCAHTRDPQPISQHQANDDRMSCKKIKVEYISNTQIAQAKIKKNNKDDIQDILLFMFIWPGLADFKNADGTEGNALLDRNIQLRNMAIEKGCDVSNFPEQPERYE